MYQCLYCTEQSWQQFGDAVCDDCWELYTVDINYKPDNIKTMTKKEEVIITPKNSKGERLTLNIKRARFEKLLEVGKFAAVRVRDMVTGVKYFVRLTDNGDAVAKRLLINNEHYDRKKESRLRSN